MINEKRGNVLVLNPGECCGYLSGKATFAILDSWLNYGIRFSEYSLSQLKKYELTKKHIYLPRHDLQRRGQAALLAQ